jgi:hypothetical protein
MKSVILKKCRVMDRCFAEESGDSREVSLSKFKSEFIPAEDTNGSYKIPLIKPGAYIGKSETKLGTRFFVLINPEMSSDISWVTRKDPSFTKRISNVYRVESVTWDGQVQESPSI